MSVYGLPHTYIAFVSLANCCRIFVNNKVLVVVTNNGFSGRALPHFHLSRDVRLKERIKRKRESHAHRTLATFIDEN